MVKEDFPCLDGEDLDVEDLGDLVDHLVGVKAGEGESSQEEHYNQELLEDEEGHYSDEYREDASQKCLNLQGSEVFPA